MENLGKIVACLKEKGEAKNVVEEFLDTVVKYLAQGINYEDHAQIRQKLLEKFEEGVEKMPTIAEHYIEEGMQNGLEKGLEKGLEQGVREAILENLEIRYAKVPEQIVNKIEALADIQKLRNLRRKTLTAASLEEFENSISAEI